MELLWPLSDKLQPYKDHVSLAATVITVFQLLTPALLVNDIRKAKSSLNFPIAPFCGGFVLSVLFVQFGHIIGDPVTVKVNLIGVALNIIYLTFYYLYTPTKDKIAVWGKIGIAGALVAASISYTSYEDPELLEPRFGMIITLLLYVLIAMPLLDLKTVIKNKSTHGWPFPIIFMGFMVSSSWLLYGIILKSVFMIYQNLIAVAICGFQLFFFIIYPSTPPLEDKQKKKN